MNPQATIIQKIEQKLSLAHACLIDDSTAASEHGAILIEEARRHLTCVTPHTPASVAHQDKLLKILFSDEKGKLLKAWREELKLTQTELASVTGIEQSAVSKIESGYSGISLVTFVSLLQALLDREDVMRSQQASAPDSGDGGTSTGS